MATVFERWAQTASELKAAKATPEQVEAARNELRKRFAEKMKEAKLDEAARSVALNRFESGTNALSIKHGLKKEDDPLTEDERYAAENPVLGGITQAGKELVAPLAQGVQRIAGGAARLLNDIGDNEKGTALDRFANSMDDAQESVDDWAGQGYAEADGVRGFAKSALQNAPQIALSFLPGAALGKAAALAKAAKGAQAGAKVLKYGMPVAVGLSFGQNHAGEYGDARKQTEYKLASATPDDLRKSKEYGSDFARLERKFFDDGLSADDAATAARDALVDSIAERRADAAAIINTGLEFVAPGAMSVMPGFAKTGSRLASDLALAGKMASGGRFGSKAANLSDLKDVGLQFLQEGLQGGVTERAAEGARANAFNDEVDYGSVMKSAALEAAAGGIMGGAAQMASGGTSRRRAQDAAKEVQARREQYSAALNNAKAERQRLSEIRNQRPLTEDENIELSAATMEEQQARAAISEIDKMMSEAGLQNPGQPPAPQSTQEEGRSTPEPAAGQPDITQNPPPEPASGLSGVVQRAQVSTAPDLTTVVNEAIASGQTPDFGALAQASNRDRSEVVDLFNRRRTLVELADAGDLNGMRDMAARMTADPQEQQSLIEQAVAVRDKRRVVASQPQPTQRAEPQQPATPIKTPRDTAYEKMLADTEASLASGASDVDTFLAVRKKYASNKDLADTDINGVIDDAKASLSGKRDIAAKREAAIESAIPHLKAGDEVSAVTALADAGISGDADIQAALKEASGRIKAKQKAPAAPKATAAPAKSPMEQAVSAVSAAEASGKGVKLATIAKKFGVSIAELAKQVAQSKRAQANTRQPEEDKPKQAAALALPAPQDAPIPAGQPLVSRRGKLLPKAQADAMAEQAAAEKRDMRRAMSEEAGNPTGVPTGMRPRVETPARAPQKAVLPDVILRTDGKPFPNETEATRAMKRKGAQDTHEVAVVDGGIAIVKKQDSGLVVKNPKTGAEVQVSSIEDAASKFSRLIAETGADPAGGMDVFDAKTGQPVANVKADGSWSEIETMEQARERSARAVSELNKRPTARRIAAIDVEKDDILAAIAKAGGVNWDQARKQGGFDPAESGRRGFGILRVFKKNGGMTLDGMAEALSQYGYPVTDADGNYTVNALLDAMDAALRGGQVGTAQFNERLAREMYEQEAEWQALDDAFDGKSSGSVPAWLDDGADALVESVIDGEAQPPAVMADALNEVENERTIASPAAGSGQETDARAEARGGERGNAPTAGPREGGQQEGQGGFGQDPGVQAGFQLTAQTEAERLAEEQRQAADLEAKRKEEEKARLKAQADRELSSFMLTGSDRPADVAMAAGQNDLFGPKTRGEKASESKAASQQAKDAAESKPEQGGATRITPEAAGDMKTGDIIKTSNGDEYVAMRTRHDFMDANPIVDGKPVVNRDSTVRFHLNPNTASAYPERNHAPIYKTGRNQYEEPVRGMTEEGRAKDGKPIIGGDKFRTSSGRETTPYPHQKSEKYASQWLIDNATAEAEARGDDFNAPIFRRTTLLKNGRLTDADRDSMLMYLFGEQQKVVPSILKPLNHEGLQSAQDHAKTPELNQVEAVAEQQSKEVSQQKPADPDAFDAFAKRLGQGKVTLEEFKRRFDDLTANKDAVMEELSAKTKDQLLSGMGPMKAARYRNDKKDAIVRAAYSDMLTEFTMHKSLTYGMDGPEPAVRRMVANMTEADLAEYASRVAERRKEIDEARKNYANALENPQSMEDYRAYIRAKREGGMTYREAFLSLNPEQREKYDALEAEATKTRREERQRAEKTRIEAAQQKTGASIIETKHTQKDHDLFVVKLDDRVDRDSYNTLNAAAKRLGGYYSSYRAGGAVPGFQFTERANAEAFSKLVQGDATQAKEAINEKRDAFEDNKAQTAADRLDEMAQRLEETADAALNAERKTNTSRRARFADAAMREAYAQQAMAKTMRNLSESIRSGSAKFLGMVRQKVQIETLNRLVASAHENYLKDKYKENWYSKREEPVTKASADHADFPTFTAWKSDLATLGRQLMQIPGAKRIGEALTKTADDVTEDYLAFARENIQKVSHFRLKDGTGAVFPSREVAENAIYKSGLSDRAIVLPVKRGENRIILSPKAAADLGVWHAEDKRITLKPDFADEMVGKMTEYPKQVTQLHGLLSAKERIDRLKGMGIETPTELRAALREYIGLKEEAKRDKIREMELSMVGRQNDGLDFFPTPEATVDRMIEEADIKPGMSVLEPEAGMGHIADLLREAGHEPEVMEISPSRRELLLAKGYRFPVEGEGDFMKVMPRTFHTFGDTFKAPDGTVGIMRGQGGMGSDRVRLDDKQGNTLGYYNRDELTPVGHRGTASGYDRIIMNPPFSNRQDAAHVMHAYDHLADGGRLVAIVGEGVFNGSDAKAVNFREWLSEHDARIEKLDAGTFNDPSLPVTTQANARMVVIDKKSSPNTSSGDVKFSIADKESLNFAADFLAQLADADEIFRYPVSSAKSLRAIMAEVFPEASYAGDNTRPDERSESGADKRTLFRTELGKLFHVYERGDQVWIDVSKLNEGDKGSGVYAAVGNYAHNNRKVFVGDPAGLSEAAVVRRTNAMLSLALRFGSTDFMDAAKEQIAGNPENGIAPLNWRGSDLDKITALIDTVLQNMHNKIPGLKDGYRYDFAKRGFIDRLGRPVSTERFREASRDVAGRARAGQATLRRGILLQSLVSSPSSQRPGILEQVLRRGGALGFARNGLDGVFSASNSEASSDGLTISRAREILSADPVLSKAMPFIDIRNSKEGVPEGAEPMYLPAWHGSPYKFDKFSLGHIGRGEGNQAYGWGLYFAGNKQVAEFYRKALSFPDFDSISVDAIFDAIKKRYYKSSYAAADLVDEIEYRDDQGGAGRPQEQFDRMALDDLIRDWWNDPETYSRALRIAEDVGAKPKGGQLYKVEIPEDDTYLLWDKPLSEQPEAVRKALRSAMLDKGFDQSQIDSMFGRDIDGDQAYAYIGGIAGAEAGSRFLNKHGISGIKYLDGSSRSKGDGNYNYVVFDDNAVKIMETFYSAGSNNTAEGYYHNGRITLFADNIRPFPPAQLTADERLKWVAFHEITHRGVAGLAESQAYLSELERAGKNPYVKNLAKKIHEARQGLDEKYHVSMEVAAEEALAEINAALRTGNVKQIKEQYGLHFPLSIRPRAKSAAARFIEVVKRIFNRMFGRGLTDAQVENLLRKTHEAGMGPDGTNPSSRRNSFAGENSKTADMTALDKAKQRVAAGDNAEAVRKDTGWHTGLDGKWRFEIDDSKAYIKGKGSVLGKPMKSNADIASIIKANRYSPYRASAKLGSILHHPDLFRAYPDLANIDVWAEKKGSGSDGSFEPESGVLTVREDLSGSDALSVIHHEIQHAIQENEGFATGGRASTSAMSSGNYDYLAYSRLAGEVESRNTEARANMTDAERRATSPKSTADVAEWDQIVTFAKGLAEMVSDKPTDANLSEAQRQLNEQLAIADRMIAERGGLFAPNGKKSKLSRHQWAQVRTANFKRWFGDWESDPAKASKVVDDNGEPLVVYHGSRSTEALTEFVVSQSEASDTRLKRTKDGAYFTRNPDKAAVYAGQDGSTYPVYLNISNPKMIADAFGSVEVDAAQLTDEGFDGLWNPKGFPSDEIVAIRKNQIKSASGNAGTFSGNTNDIRYSPAPKDWITEQGRITKRVLSKEVAQRDLTPWQKTLGTQLNAALKNPAFKKVYDLTQRLIQHVNNDAYDSLNAAPDVLSRLEDWNDYKRDLTNTAKEAGAALTMRQSKRRKDMTAAAEVLFEGTRFDKKVYSDKELDAFKLTADQKEIYRQARAAIDKSVGNAGKSQALNVAINAEAINWETVERLVNMDLDPEVLFSEVSDLIDTRIAATKMEAENSTSEAEIKKLDKQVEKLSAALASIGEIQAIVEKSATEGYAPLMRWGKYTVAVIDPADGKTLRFHMLESKREQAALELQLREKYGAANVVGGVIDEGKFEQFKGITPETVALFASVTGMDQDAAYQEYLKLAIPGRSALKRKIHRKGDMGEGIEGFSTDLPRVLSSFVLSNARKSARDLYRKPIDASVADIPKGSGGVAAKARELAKFVLEPDENDWSVGIRNLLFVWNMGASVAFGVLNLSQPWMMTLPWLSQFSDPAKAAGIMGRAAKLATAAQVSGKAPKGYEAEYDRAVREGIVDPQNVFMLQGTERGKSSVGANIWRNIAHGMGLIAAATESMNRKLTLIASLDIARAKGDAWLKSKGFADAYDFAARSVAETQGVYNKGNRPAWARSPVGAVLLVFKQYSINWVEMASRMASNHYGDDRYRKGFWMLVGALFMMAGGMGLPFAEDLIDLIETGMSWAGKPMNIERQMQMALGKDLYEPLMNGPVNSMLFNAAGADMFGRMSMGNLIPATAIANPGLAPAARSDEAVQALGAGAGLASKFMDAYDQAASGDIGHALVTASPRAVTSIAKAAEMTATGQYKDSKGRTVRSVTPAEALIKGLDLQPASVARIQRERGRRFKDEAIQAQARTEVRNALIDAYESGDQTAIDEANNRLRTWNKENPLYPVSINRRTLRKTVRERGKNWSARDEAPKGMEWMDDWIPENSK